tara:strand:- start:847 stop:1449 length:603 start_codon:yes stop_codon:yes gene_type:complete
MKKLFPIIIAAVLYACSTGNERRPVEIQTNDSSALEQTQSGSLSLQLSEIRETNLDSITYSSQIIYPSIETSDSLKLRIAVRNHSLKEKRIFIDKGTQTEYMGTHPLLHSLEIYNEYDSAMVYMKWAELSSNAEIVTKEYLEQLEASKESILPNDSIVSQFYISRVVKYKGDQQLQKGNYRLVIGDKNNYSDTLSFEVIN